MHAALPDVLSAADVAELLDCTPETVEERTRRRELPGVQYGRSWRYPREALLRVLEQQALAHVQAPAAASPPAPAAPMRVVPMPARPAARNPQRQRGRTPAPLPDPPVGPA